MASGAVERARLEHAVTDDEECEHGDERRIGKACEKRGRPEKIAAIAAGDRKEIEEKQQRAEDREGGDLKRNPLHAEQEDRGQNEAVGHPHLPEEFNLHARVFLMSTTMPVMAVVLEK